MDDQPDLRGNPADQPTIEVGELTADIGQQDHSGQLRAGLKVLACERIPGAFGFQWGRGVPVARRINQVGDRLVCRTDREIVERLRSPRSTA